MNKFVSGGLAVAAVVAFKIALKAGIIAAIFGGGVVANNAYQSRLAEVQKEVAVFNREHTDQKITVDETNRRYIISIKVDNIHDATPIDSAQIPRIMDEAKQENIRDILSHGDQYTNKFLISQGWTEVVRFVTVEGTTIGETSITAEDLN